GTLYPWTWQWPANLQRFDHIAPHDHPAFYSSSRLTLNITRAEMARYGYCPSGRFFEAAACRTPIVSDWWEGLETFFDRDQILVCTSTDEGLAALAASDADLTQIASPARARTLDEHSGDHRAQELLAYLEEARAARRSLTPPSASLTSQELAS